MSVTKNKWACGCPKPLSCQKQGYIQLTLENELELIPQVGSPITQGSSTLGYYLDISTDKKIIWVEKISGQFVTGNITTTPTQSSQAFINLIQDSNCCSKCTLQYIKQGVTVCKGTGNSFPNKQYNTAYNSDYYFNQYPQIRMPKVANRFNCCHGQYKWLNNNVFFTKNNRGKIFGDISYPRNQRGRWNESLSNWKLFPRNSIGRPNPICDSATCTDPVAKTNAAMGPLQYGHSGRLFINTHPNMSKKKLFSYLTKNRNYLNK